MLTGSTPRVSRYPLITPAGVSPRACLGACAACMGHIRRIDAPRILPTAGNGAAVNVCPGGCPALYAFRLHHIGRPSAAPAILCRQTADGNTRRASSAGRVLSMQAATPPGAGGYMSAPLVSVKPRQAVKRAGAGCRVSGAVIL